MTVWIYIDTRKPLSGNKVHLKLFANAEVAKAWFERYNPEGVAFALGFRVGLIGRRLIVY